LRPHHARWMNVVDVWILPPLAASGALRSLDGERSRHLAHCAQSQAWVLSYRFDFPLWYKQQGAEPLTLLL
jgi:hypothetical protein